MTRHSNRLVRVLAIGSLLFITLALAVSAQAGEPTPPEPVTIEFVDEGKLTVHQEWLSAHQEELPVKIVNKSLVTQSVTLSLEGFVPKSKEPEAALGGLLPAEDTQELKSGEIKTFRLHFEGIDTAQLEEKAYTGVLVAISNPGGDVIRREFELQAEPKAAASPTVEEEPSLLSKLWNPPRIEVSDKLTELTSTGVGFLPSLLNPLPAALFVIGVALLVFRWGGDKLELALSDVAKKSSLWAGLICLSAGIVMFVLSWTGVGGPLGLSLVYIEPLSVPSDAELGPVKGGGSSLGVLERSEEDGEGSLVYVRQIPGAGAYEARIDLTPGEEEGELTLKLNVADWWPYALLTITLGVLVGYWVTKYYSQKRGVSEQKVHAAELWREIARTEAEFQARNAGHPQAVYTMSDMAKQWIDGAEQDLNDPGNIDAVKTDLGKLETYHDAFVRLQSRLVSLEQLYHQVRARIDLEQFAVDPAFVEVYTHTKEILAGRSKSGPPPYAPFAFATNEDKDGTRRKACEGEVAEYAQWLCTLEQKYQQMVQRWNYALEVKKQWKLPDTHADTQLLVQQMNALKTAIKNALMANSQKEVEDAETASQGAKVAIENLAKKHPKIVSYVAQPPPRLPLLAYGLAPARVATPGTTASKISVRPLEVESYGKRYSGDPDTLFDFSTTVKFAQPGAYLLQWDFDDGLVSEPWVKEIKPGDSLSVPLETSHCYKKGGNYTVSLKVDGTTVTTTKQDEIRIAPKGLWQRLSERLQLTDKQMTCVTGLLAVASGFTVKYLANATWGTPKDYLEAFLWGAIGSEGLKYVAQLVKKTWDPG